MSLAVPVALAHYLVVSGAVFGIGIAIALAKRNAVAVLMGIELMLNAVNLALVAFSRFSAAFPPGEPPLAGHVFVVFVLTVAAAEAAVALAMAVLVYRRRETVDLDRVNLMRWQAAHDGGKTMWVKFMEVPDGYAAATWREVFSQEALAVRIVPPLEVGSMRDARSIWVPDGKTHVAREVLNKI